MRLSTPSLIALVLVAACGDAGTDRIATPRTVGPSFELVDPKQRLDPRLVNAHTYGTFVIPFESGPEVIRSGAANFPGNPPGGPGTCRDGLWINSRGRATAGTLDNPHPHCVSAASAVTIVLEPISSYAWDPSRACNESDARCHFIHFTDPRAGDLDVESTMPDIKGNFGQTDGSGRLYAYAIDASTLGGTNVRVGTLTIDLNQYDDRGLDIFGTCELDDTSTYQCLPRVVTASYTPLAVGGVGTATTVSGFLWWAPAGRPYNYF